MSGDARASITTASKSAAPFLTWAYEGQSGCDLLGRVAEAIGGSQRKTL